MDIHKRVVEIIFSSNITIVNYLIDIDATYGTNRHRNAVSWNVMITSYGSVEKA